MQPDGFIDQIGRRLKAGTEPGAVDDNSSKMKNNISYKLKSEWFKMDATLHEWWGGRTGEVLPDSVDKCERILAGWLMRFVSFHLTQDLNFDWETDSYTNPHLLACNWVKIYERTIIDSVGSNAFQSYRLYGIIFFWEHNINDYYWRKIVPLQHLLILVNINLT